MENKTQIITLLVIAVIVVLIGSYVTAIANFVVGFLLVLILTAMLIIIIKGILKGGTETMLNMREYKIVQLEKSNDFTEDKLNRLAKDNWKVICSIDNGKTIILERGAW